MCDNGFLPERSRARVDLSKRKVRYSCFVLFLSAYSRQLSFQHEEAHTFDPTHLSQRAEREAISISCTRVSYIYHFPTKPNMAVRPLRFPSSQLNVLF